MEQSRRDDLEAVGHIIIYLAQKGTIPWDQIEFEDEKKELKEVRKCKETTPVSVLCEGLPPCFKEYMSYVKNLKFEQEPDYGMLKAIFQDYYSECKYESPEKMKFDWAI